MKRCCIPILHVLSCISIAVATNLRTSISPSTDIEFLREHKDPGLTVGIGGAGGAGSKKGSWDPSAKKDGHPEYKITLHNYKGVQYFAPIVLNNQRLMAVWDTGSFEIMAMSKACTVCKVPVTTYDAGLSNTFVEGTKQWHNHHFAGGLVVAKQDYETVHVGDLGQDFLVKDMPFWQVMSTNMKVWMNSKAQFAAIVGLGHREKAPSFRAQKSVPGASLLERTETTRFAICLMRGPKNPGYITFNPHMDSMTANMFRRVPVIGKNHWAVKLDEASSVDSVGTKIHSRCSASSGESCVAIVDSGTSLIGVPKMAVPLVMPLIKAIKEDCSNLHQLKDLVLSIGGHHLVLPGEAYVVQFRVGTVRKCLPAFMDFNMNSAHGNVWILGMPFLRHFYTVFDRTEPSLYIADQGPNCEPIANTNSSSSFHNAGSFSVNRTFMEPTFMDKAEATLPSWAYGKSVVDI